MKKKDLKKLALLGIAGGLMMTAQPAQAQTADENSVDGTYLAGGCGKGKCSGRSDGNYGSQSYYNQGYWADNTGSQSGAESHHCAGSNAPQGSNHCNGNTPPQGGHSCAGSGNCSGKPQPQAGQPSSQQGSQQSPQSGYRQYPSNNAGQQNYYYPNS